MLNSALDLSCFDSRKLSRYPVLSLFFSFFFPFGCLRESYTLSRWFIAMVLETERSAFVLPREWRGERWGEENEWACVQVDLSGILCTHWNMYCYKYSVMIFESESESCSVVSDSLWPCGVYSFWNSPGKNTGVVSLSLLQGIFLTQGLNPGLLCCRWVPYQLSHQGSL